MSNHGMVGEVVVAGLVTGTHLIEDIGVAVPDRIAVRIPADLALRSKDLWRGIAQGKLFKLDGGAGLHFSRPPAPDDNRAAQLEAENKKLRQNLESERIRNDGLQGMLQGLQGQLQGLQTAVGQLGAVQRIVHVTASSSNGAVVAAGSGAVGGDVPTFLPERIRPEAVETQIRAATETTETANVASAASKLREMRKQGGG